MERSIIVNGVEKVLDLDPRGIFLANEFHTYVKNLEVPVFKNEPVATLSKEDKEYFVSGQLVMDHLDKTGKNLFGLKGQEELTNLKKAFFEAKIYEVLPCLHEN